MCVKTYSSPKGLRLTSYSTTETFHPTSEWMPAVEYSDWSHALMIRAEGGTTFNARPGYQLAAVRPDNPSNPVPIGSATTTDGWTRFAPGIPTLSGSLFWRFGIFYSATGGLGAADVELDTSVNDLGKVLGTRQIEVQPYNDNSDTAVFAVTPWFAPPGYKFTKAGILISSSATATLQTQLFARFGNDRGAPNGGAWTALEAGFTTAPTENSERNTGPLSVAGFGSYQWAQLGLGVKRSASPAARATIHVASVGW